MMSGWKHQQEMQQQAADRAWWIARLPVGWKLWGCNGSGNLGSAQLIAPNGNMDYVSGRLIQAFYEQKEHVT